MSRALTSLSRWWWQRAKKKDPKLENGASMDSNQEMKLWESGALKLPMTVGGNGGASKSKRLKRKLDTRHEQEYDREHDVVVVPSDGGCISDSDSDASDWSVGWSEPHGPDFHSDDDENDGGFGVLVPCYGAKHRDVGEGANKVVDMKANPDSKKYMEQWPYSLKTG